jgi:hypothetical protein
MALTRVFLAIGLSVTSAIGGLSTASAQSCLHINGSAIDMATYVDSRAHPYAKDQNFDKAAAQLILLWHAHGIDALNKAGHKWVLKNCFNSYDDCGFPKASKKAALARLKPALQSRIPFTSAHLDPKPAASAVQWAREEIGACALSEGGASPDIDSVLANVDDMFGGTASRKNVSICASAAKAIRRNGGDASKPLSAESYAKSFLDANDDARRQRICDHMPERVVKYGQDLAQYFVSLEAFQEQEAKRKRAKERAQQQSAEWRRYNPPVQNTVNAAPVYSGGYNSGGSSNYIATPPASTTKFRTCTTTQLGGYGGGNVVTCQDY